MLRFILIACLMAFVVPSQVSAQFYGGEVVTRKNVVDVIYLKDGRVIRGIILEKTDDLLSVRMGDGRVAHFKMDEVAKMFQEEQARMGMGGKKSVYLAMAFSSVFIGGGQFYNGQPVKGIIQLGLGATGFALWATSGGRSVSVSYLGYSASGGSTARYTAGLVLWSGAWLWSVVDAGLSADKINKENEYGHLIELNDDRFTLGIDPVAQPNNLGTMLTLHF